jgi:HSP20 family protein
MAVLRFDPFRDFDRLADQAFGTRSRVPAMPVDAYRRPTELVLQFDVPGVDPGSVEVTVEKSVLSVTAERHTGRREGDELLVAERPSGRFTRQLQLGDGLDADRVTATYEDGVLTVTLPVAEEVRPRRIEVQSNGHGAIGTETEEHSTGDASAAA